jgi:hypothetical protein
VVLAEERNMRMWKKSKKEWGYSNANEEMVVEDEVKYH